MHLKSIDQNNYLRIEFSLDAVHYFGFDLLGQYKVINLWNIIINDDEFVEILYFYTWILINWELSVNLFLCWGYIHFFNILYSAQEFREALCYVLIVANKKNFYGFLNKWIKFQLLLLCFIRWIIYLIILGWAFRVFVVRIALDWFSYSCFLLVALIKRIIRL